MPSSNIALLTPDGPNGKLERREPAGMDRQESREIPVQNGYRWIDDTEYGVVMATWDSTPFTSKMLPFFQHELMLVVDGSVTIVEPDGRETTVRVPAGLRPPVEADRVFSKVRYGFQRRFMGGAGRPRRPAVGCWSSPTGPWSLPVGRRRGRSSAQRRPSMSAGGSPIPRGK